MTFLLIVESEVSYANNVSDDLYARLGSHAVSFEPPELVIEKVLDVYEKVMGKKNQVLLLMVVWTSSEH